MWQDQEDSSTPTSSSNTITTAPASALAAFFPTSSPAVTESEPSSPRPTATLPSATLPATFPSRPSYTIGTRSHSYATDHLKSPPVLPASPVFSSSPSSVADSMPETDESTVGVVAAPTSPVSPQSATSPSSPSRSNSLRRASSLHRVKSSSSSTSSSSASDLVTAVGHDTTSTGVGASLPSAGVAATASLSRQSSLSLNLNRNPSLSKKQTKQQHGQQQQQQQQLDRDLAVPPSPSSTHRPQKHVMLNRRSVSQDFQIRLHQQQQRQEDLGEELSEAGEDQIPGTPTSISSFGSGTMGLSGSEREREQQGREREKTLPGRHNRSSRSSVALIESRNIQTLSSNLAMVSSPTDSEFPQQNSDSLLSVIAQKEARIAQLREDLETNLTELTQLKERWSHMMIEERNRQQAEATASIQEQERQLYGHSGSQSVSHRLSTTGAGIWGSVVGSVSGISGVSGGISLHNINALHQQHQQPQPLTGSASTQNGLASGRSSTSSNPTGKNDGQGAGTTGSSRPTSPLPAYLNSFSSLNGLSSPVSPIGHGHSNGGGLNTASAKKGDRTSLSSLSTCSSSQSNSGDGPTAFEAGHSSQSSFSSAGNPDPSALQMQLHKEQRESRRMKRESSGLFIPPEAEEVLVNTGRALFKGFGSLLGGIRTVVTDVAESDRFQHSRQRTLDMMSGLAQTAADALPLPSHDDIYYHHQRLRLLDEEEESGSGPLSAEQQLEREMLRQQHQMAKEQRRRERQKEKERRLLKEKLEGSEEVIASGGGGVARSPSLVRRASRKVGGAEKKEEEAVDVALEELKESDSKTTGASISRSVSQLSIKDSKLKRGDNDENVEDEEALEWGIEDKELLASLEADVRQQGDEKGGNGIVDGAGSDVSQKTKSEMDLEEMLMGSAIDTPVRTASFALASKKND